MTFKVISWGLYTEDSTYQVYESREEAEEAFKKVSNEVSEELHDIHFRVELVEVLSEYEKY